MNNEQQTWILKPGIDLRIVDLKDGLSFVHYVDDYVQWETEHVNALFNHPNKSSIHKNQRTRRKINTLMSTSKLPKPIISQTTLI